LGILGKPIISLGELEQALVDVSHLPENVDEVFSPSFFFNYENDDNVQNYFRFFFTTMRLLTQLTNGDNLHVGATYKVTHDAKKAD